MSRSVLLWALLALVTSALTLPAPASADPSNVTLVSGGLDLWSSGTDGACLDNFLIGGEIAAVFDDGQLVSFQAVGPVGWYTITGDAHHAVLVNKAATGGAFAGCPVTEFLTLDSVSLDCTGSSGLQIAASNSHLAIVISGSISCTSS